MDGSSATLHEAVAGWLPLADLFYRQAEAAPGRCAVVFEDEAVSYAELAARASRLARLLIARGVGPDTIVPIMLDRSVEMMVTVLGVLLAGGAYLPIDADAPESRKRAALADSQPSLILTATAADVDWVGDGIEVLRIDDPAVIAAMAALPGHAVDDAERRAPLLADHLSYIISTSGSTGTPKCSGNTQGGLANVLQWLVAEMGLTADERVLQQTAFSFDMAALEMFLPLITGGCVVLARPGGHRDTTYVTDQIQRRQVSLAFFVPTMLLDFFGDESAADCTSLRHIMAAGEVLTGHVQARCQALLPQATLWNGYGPSEAAVLVTLWRCRPQDGDTTPPIGYPSWNTQLHVLDEMMRPVARGEPGELFVSGRPLARGYLNRPDLNAEKFIPCPFGPEGSVMYRTGDIGLVRPDGAIEFHGRRDSQVKLNGIRVELGDIEAVLADLPGIARAAVIARTLSGEVRLVAYLIAAPGAEAATAAHLRRQLQDRLPRYMHPGFFIYVDAFPMTSSGKLAARELPDPDHRAAGQAPYRAPSEGMEAVLAGLFCELTGAVEVGADDDFFDLGGTSLTAIRLAARLQRSHGLGLPMRALAENPTPAGLAAAILAPASVAAASSRPIVYVFPGAGGASLGLASLCAECGEALDMRLMRFPDWVDIARDGTRFDDLLDGYLAQILAEAPQGEIAFAGYSLGGSIAYGLALRLERLGRQVGSVTLFDTEAPPPPRAPGATRRRDTLGTMWKRPDLKVVVLANLLRRTPLRVLALAPKVWTLLSPAARDAVDHRLGHHTMVALTHAWLRLPERQSERLRAPITLFEVSTTDQSSPFVGDWSHRTGTFHTRLAQGDHMSMMDGENRETLRAALKDIVLDGGARGDAA